MEAFSMLGVAAFCIAACMLGLPGRVKNWNGKSGKKNARRKRKERSSCLSF